MTKGQTCANCGAASAARTYCHLCHQYFEGEPDGHGLGECVSLCPGCLSNMAETDETGKEIPCVSCCKLAELEASWQAEREFLYALREFKKSVDNAVTAAFLSMTDDLGATDPREAIEHIRHEFRDAEMKFQQRIRVRSGPQPVPAQCPHCGIPLSGMNSNPDECLHKPTAAQPIPEVKP
jgi:hypothetical protein